MASRIDWRNYDYSEGPPKRQRDTNPYTKATDFRARALAPSPSLYVSSSYQPTSTPSIHTPDSDHDYINESNPSDSIEKTIQRSPRRNAGSASHLHSTLSYRPPLQVAPIPADDMDPSIPQVHRSLVSRRKDEDEPFDATANLQTSSTTPSPQPVTPTRDEDLTQSVNSNFEKIWQEVDSHVDDKIQYRSNYYVSDDEDEKLHHLEFDDKLARDSVTNQRVDGRTIPNTNSPSVSSSEASVAKMDVDRNFEPVGILRSNGRFAEQQPEKERQDHSRSRSVASHASSTSRRKHPWDQDFVEEDDPLVEDENVEAGGGVASSNNDRQDDDREYDHSESTMEESDLQAHLNVKSSNTGALALQSQTVQSELAHMDANLRNDNIATDKKARRKKSRRRSDVDEDDDDTSIEDAEGNSKRADTLRDRTKQAWSMRNQANIIAGRSVSKGRNTRQDETGRQDDKPRKSLVSFQQDTVHEFVPEEEEEDIGSQSDSATEVTDYTERTGDYTYDDEDTFAGRSMHSVYTKSNESEAEDLFKDLFFIGSGKATNPGRRQIKYKKGFKEEYKAQKKEKAVQVSDEEDETTFEEQSTIDGSLTTPDQNKNRKKSYKTTEDDESVSRTDTKSAATFDDFENDAFTATYNYCEDLVKAIAAACGFSSNTEKKSTSESDENQIVDKHDVSDETSLVDSFVDYATNAMFPHHKTAFTKEQNKKALTELAINAAITKHSMQNTVFDEMHELCLNRDIKIVKTSIGLPIGIIFSESHTCCWVKRIFETGHAATAFVGDKIDVGDQLAAVNGLSAMYKNVAEVCRILANAPNPESIELTFVRYVGPLRVAPNDQQGYEVIDTKLNKPGKLSPSTLSKKISFSRPRSPTSKAPKPISFPQEILDDSAKSSTKVISSQPPASSRQPAKKLTASQEPTSTKTKKEKKKIFSFFRRKGKKKNK